MKQNITTFKTSLLLAGSLALAASCQDYEPFSEQQVQNVAYNHEFVKQFGDIDPNQNWDLFGQLARGRRGAVTRAATASDLEVIPAGDYTETISQEESQEYKKVMPESNVDVKSDGRPYEETNLPRVVHDFVTSAKEFTLILTYYFTNKTDEVGVYWYADEDTPGATSRDEYYIVHAPILTNQKDESYLKGVKNSTSVSAIEGAAIQTAFDELVQNFPDEYEKDGNNLKVLVDGNWITIYNPYRLNATWGSSYEKAVNDLISLHPDYKISDGSNGLDNGTLYKEVSELVNPGTNDSRTTDGYFENGAEYLISRPITVKIPDDVPYVGFYVRTTEQNSTSTVYLYSESKLNPKYTFENGEEKAISYAATFDIHDIDPTQESKRFLCFEDWYPGLNGNMSSDFDLNDVIFTVVGMDNTTIKDNESSNETAILVCEDLKQYDFDFNDIALKLNYADGVSREYDVDANHNVTAVRISKNQKLTVTAMAAGGAYESVINVNGTEWGEIHSLMGEGSVDNVRKHSIINAAATYGGDGSSISFENTFDENGDIITRVLPDKDDSYPTYLSQLFQYEITKPDNTTEGFFKIVCDNGETEESKKGTLEASKIIESGTYAEGSAPQMMLLPEYFEWPQEEVYIKEAYDKFEEWVSDVNATDWILTSQNEISVTDRGDFAIEADFSKPVGEPQELTVTNGQTFTYIDKYGVETSYNNCAKIDLSGVSATDNQCATLTVTFTQKPSTGKTYLDYADGKQLKEYSNVADVQTFKLTQREFKKARETGAIYIMGQNNQPIEVSSAVLTIRE